MLQLQRQEIKVSYPISYKDFSAQILTSISRKKEATCLKYLHKTITFGLVVCFPNLPSLTNFLKCMKKYLIPFAGVTAYSLQEICKLQEKEVEGRKK